MPTINFMLNFANIPMFMIYVFAIISSNLPFILILIHATLSFQQKIQGAFASARAGLKIVMPVEEGSNSKKASYGSRL